MRCNTVDLLCDLVPMWKEHFDYCGVAIGNEDWSSRPLYDRHDDRI